MPVNIMNTEVEIPSGESAHIQQLGLFVLLKFAYLFDTYLLAFVFSFVNIGKPTTGEWFFSQFHLPQ
jgi:hypothetical protein